MDTSYQSLIVKLTILQEEIHYLIVELETHASFCNEASNSYNFMHLIAFGH